MKASETYLGKILEGTNQFIVPLFQRPYTWDEQRWQILWSDLVDLCEDAEDTTRKNKPHFLGSIVTMRTSSVPERVTKYLLIDGQQRLTTLQVLIAVIRDRTRQDMKGSLSESAERLEKIYLINQFSKELDHFKLLPTQTNADRNTFFSIVKGKDISDKENRIARSYEWFQKKLNAKGSPNREKLEDVILNRLSLVSIVLEHDDNPHLIFESLNYKGESLTQADLIRNYILMRFQASDQEKLFQRNWEPMQSHLQDNLTEFMRHYLIMRLGTMVKQGEIYHTTKERYDNLNSDAISILLDQMHRSALHYHCLLDPSQEKNTDIQMRLHRFAQLEVSVAWPLILNLYAEQDAGFLSTIEFCEILDILENYFIRRFICGMRTNDLNKILSPLYHQAKEQTKILKDGIKTILSQKNYPSDIDFKNNLINARLYYSPGTKSSKINLVLETMEKFLAGKEPVSTESLTIEHIMPQTITPSWQKQLGDNWRETYDLKLHTLGNLTLTGYNAELSNSDFITKRNLFRQSSIRLSRSIIRFNQWNEEAIQQRAEELAEIAMQIWPYFGPAKSQLPSAIQSNYTNKKPVACTALGITRKVNTWREVLQATLEIIRENAENFDEVIEQFPRLLSREASALRSPRALDSQLYFETNLSAESVARYCQQMIIVAGYAATDWSVEFR